MVETPIQLNLGTGRFSVEPFSDARGHGIVLADTGTQHVIGELDPDSKPVEHFPEPGEFYIHCANRESALVLLEQVARVVAAFSST